MDLLADLRAATRPRHDALERLPLPQALADGSVARADYVALLGKLVWVHRAFEERAGLLPGWPAEARRADAAARDLAALGGEPPPEPESVKRWRAELSDSVSPVGSWAGAAYVLEGSRMGGRLLEKGVARALGLADGPGQGLDYHREGLDDPRGRWGRAFAAVQAADGPDARAAIVAGAVATFGLMAELHAPGGAS